MSTHVFVGPTIPQQEVRERLPGAGLHPPVAHGDLLQLGVCQGDTVLIIDGDFFDRLPLRNQEIMLLLQEGVRVVGAAGMGALRAAELHAYGMLGIGAVFEMYRDGAIVGDDEVAVRHAGEEANYAPASESMINIRHVLDLAVADGILSADESALLSGFAESLPIADRSWAAIEAWLARGSNEGAEQLLARVTDLAGREQPGVQFQDARAALDLVAGHGLRPAAGVIDPPTRVPVTPYVKAWLDQHRISRVDGELVDDVSVLRFLQLYDPAFPERWALFAMGVIADGAPRTHPISVAARRELADLCLERAADRLGGALLEGLGRPYWLAGRESSLDDREQLLRVLVRSYRAPGGAPFHGCPQLFTRPAANWQIASHAVAACRRENRRVSELSARYSVQRLKRERVLSHFSKIWGVEDAPDAMLAAARDRAIPSLGQLHSYGREVMLPFLDWDADDVARLLASSERTDRRVASEPDRHGIRA